MTIISIPEEKRGNLKEPRDKVCKQCQQIFTTYWARESVCVECKPLRASAAGRTGVEARTNSKSAALEQIWDTCGKQKTYLADVYERPRMEWVVTYSVPFALESSKNRRWSNNGKGVVFLSKAVRSYSDMIVMATKAALKGVEVKQNKVWISMHVEKLNHRFDAINVVDTVCDAIKVAIEVDDNWFCLGMIDWSIKKKDPSIIISIGQESSEHAQVCSHCGSIKSLPEFTIKKSQKFGVDRVCKECKTILNDEAKKARRRIG